MVIRIIAYGCIILALSCTANQEGKTSATSTETLPETQQNLAGCYQMVIGKDTAYLSLTKDTQGYAGDLWYQRYEKDDNKGSLQLIAETEYLRGWYEFESEGWVSVREIKFKILEDSLAEGYGDVAMYGDTVKYKYPENLEYETKNPFVRMVCKN